MKYDDYLKMYFNKSYQFKIVDSLNQSKKGDIILAKRLANPPTQTLLYEIESILFKIDNIVDPITNKNLTKETDLINEHLLNLQKSKVNI